MSSTTAKAEKSPVRNGASLAQEDSLLTALFEGRLRDDLFSPWREPDPEEREMLEVLEEAVGRYLSDKVDPVRIDREAKIPDEVLDGLRELGLFGLIVPEQYGGLGLSQTAYTRIVALVTAHCASTAATLGAHSSIGLKAILMFGNEEQKQRWLPDLATGEKIAAFCLTEAGSGSDAGSIRAKAEPHPDGGWTLSGEKVWITNGGIGGLYTVFARTPAPEGWPAERPHHACFVVDRSQPGVSTGIEEDKLGLKGSSTTTVVFDDVRLDDSQLLGSDGEGFKMALEVLNSGRLGLAGACAASARKLLSLALEQAKARQQFGRQIASFGLIQQKLAMMASEVYAMESMAYLIAGIVDRRVKGEHDAPNALESAACKIYCTERLWEIAHEALQIAGGNGFMREFPYERVLRDSRVNMIFEGTNEILRLMVALGGLKNVGKKLKKTMRGLKSAAGFVPSLVELAAFKYGPVPRFPCPVEGDAEARHAWKAVETCLRAIPRGARLALERHGKAILEAQEPLALIADIAQDALVALAVFARAFTGEPGDAPKGLALNALARRRRHARSALAELVAGPPVGQVEVVDWLLESP